MKILVACEESQAVCNELRSLGHEAYSCDVVECGGGHPEYHIKQDVVPLLDGFCVFETQDGVVHGIDSKWDMIIAFPPCTHLAVSGARYFKDKRDDGRQRDAIEFFAKFIIADCERICIENPVNIISGKYIEEYFPDLSKKYGFPIKPTQRVHPWMFGDNYSNNTCLWLKNLEPLQVDNTEPPDMEWVTWIDKRTGKKKRQNKWIYDILIEANTAEERSKLRSRTFPGIANAMAKQWCGEIAKENGN